MSAQTDMGGCMQMGGRAVGGANPKTPKRLGRVRPSHEGSEVRGAANGSFSLRLVVLSLLRFTKLMEAAVTLGAARMSKDEVLYVFFVLLCCGSDGGFL